MKDYRENIFRIIITIGAILSSLLVLLVFYYILKESLPFFKDVNFREYILGQSWAPLSSKPNYSFFQ